MSKIVSAPAMFQDVADFHRKFGIQYDGPPRDLPEDLRLFRARRFLEEINEIEKARYLDDRLDGYVDLVYIILGTCHLHGWDFNEAWRRVHAANMAKERASKENPGKYGSPSDIVKPKGWKAPDLSDLA